MASISVDPKQIQGNVLKGFGREHGVFLFLAFPKLEPDQRSQLARVLKQHVTSAATQAAVSALWKLQPAALSDAVGMFGVSYDGCVSLGVADSIPQVDQVPFRRKPQESGYAGNPEAEWHDGYKQNFHAFLFLADDHLPRLNGIVSNLQRDLSGLATIVHREYGYRRRSESHDVEHFGFRDGVSHQPDPIAVFSPEPRDEATHGCFAAFMKFEQHVEAFRAKAAALSAYAAEQGFEVNTQATEQLATGRRYDGEPLVARGADADDFDFASAAHSECPMHSHIRVMNPRDGKQRASIIRRGLTYPQGLLFFSLQRGLFDLENIMTRAQYRRDAILSRSSLWTEYPDPPYAAVGELGPGQPWSIGGADFCYPFADVVTLRGARYFYIPSLPWIERLVSA